MHPGQLIAKWLPIMQLPFWKRLGVPEPGLHDVPDMTGHGMSFGFIVMTHSGYWQPTHEPSVGDVVIQLESDGMGMSVRRDIRWRVMARVTEMVWEDGVQKPYSAIRIRNENGEERPLLCLKLFPHSTVKRTFIWSD